MQRAQPLTAGVILVILDSLWPKKVNDMLIWIINSPPQQILRVQPPSGSHNLSPSSSFRIRGLNRWLQGVGDISGEIYADSPYCHL